MPLVTATARVVVEAAQRATERHALDFWFLVGRAAALTPLPFDAQVRMYAAAKEATKLPSDEKLAFCYDMLNAVSRR